MWLFQSYDYLQCCILGLSWVTMVMSKSSSGRHLISKVVSALILETCSFAWQKRLGDVTKLKCGVGFSTALMEGQ